MNRAAFFASLKGEAIFPHGLTQQQVMDSPNLLDVGEKHYFADPLNLLAYNLATAFHETAGICSQSRRGDGLLLQQV